MMIFRLIVISIFCAVNLAANAQFTHPQYRQYTLRDGLSQMQVISLFQDSRGYIWAGTKGGVNCLNGNNITKFTVKDGLDNDFGLKIIEDYSGNIWVSTFKGFSRYNGVKWESFPLTIRNPAMLAPTPDGKIWYLATSQESKPLFGYIENGEFHDQQNLLPPLDVSWNCNIAYSKENNALVLSDNHHLYELKDGKANQLLSVPEFLVMEKNGSAVLIYASDGGTNTNLFEYADGLVHELAKIKGDKVTRVGRASSVYTIHNPITGSHVITLSPDTFTVQSFPEIIIDCCLTDRDGHLWIGSEHGLYNIFSSGFETYNREYLPSIWSTAEDMDGNIWFASFEYGLKKFNGKTIEAFSAAETEKPGKWFYFHPSVDKRGTLYFPNRMGVLTYDGQHFGRLNGVNCMTSFYDRDRDLLWVGSRKLAEVYDQHKKLIRTIKPEDGMALNGYVLSILKDNEGFYWLGGGSGLCRYNYDIREFVNYNRANGRLPVNGVMSSHNTPDGRIWFGSTNGLLYFDNKADSIRKVECEEISGSVSFVTSIDSSWLVFGKSEGIYLMNLKKFNNTGEVELHLFNEHNGYLGIDPGQDGSMIDSKGNIWITSSSEIVKLDPRKLDFKKNSVSVRIDAFNGQKLPYNQQQITLPRNDRSAVIQFDAVCFNRPNPVQYSWKIEGSGTGWSTWQKEDYAVLTNLPNGILNFQVRMKVPGLPIEETTASLFVKVSLAIWKQPWFFPTMFGLFALTSLLVFLLLLRTRTQMMLAARQSKVFQVQAIQSQMNPHFIFNVLASFQSMILSLQTEKANQYLVKLARLIRGFLDASSESSDLQNQMATDKGQTLKKELDLIKGFVDFQQLIYPDKFEYIVETDAAIDLERETIPPMILQPFVENAIRHGLLLKNGKGALKISITRMGVTGLQIKIEDNGVGIEKVGKMLADSPFRYESKGTMLTLNRIRLLNELGYHITIQTESSGEGTKIELTILNHEQRN